MIINIRTSDDAAVLANLREQIRDNRGIYDDDGRQVGTAFFPEAEVAPIFVVNEPDLGLIQTSVNNGYNVIVCGPVPLDLVGDIDSLLVTDNGSYADVNTLTGADLNACADIVEEALGL